MRKLLQPYQIIEDVLLKWKGEEEEEEEEKENSSYRSEFKKF